MSQDVYISRYSVRVVPPMSRYFCVRSFMTNLCQDLGDCQILQMIGQEVVRSSLKNMQGMGYTNGEFAADFAHLGMEVQSLQG